MEIVNFLATDKVELNGILYNQNCQNIQDRKIILAVHGMTSNCFKKRDEVIADYAKKSGIGYFCFNNRGSEISRYISRKKKCKSLEKELGGTAYEDVLDGYYDISGAILRLIELGYTKIYLQGHSLGCTKIVYTYNKLKDEKSQLLKYIKGVILLSLVDVPATLKFYLGNKYDRYLKIAESKESEGKNLELMPNESFIHPISVKSFLRYARDNKEIDFVDMNKDPELKKINSIEVPLFIRWGNVNELILEDAKDYSEKVNEIVTNNNKDINYIKGADHGYHNKEEELAKQIVSFVSRTAK